MVIGIARKEGGVGIGDGAGNGKLGGRRGGVKKEGKGRGERILFSPGSFSSRFFFGEHWSLISEEDNSWGKGAIVGNGHGFWGLSKRERERVLAPLGFWRRTRKTVSSSEYRKLSAKIFFFSPPPPSLAWRRP